MSKPQVWFDRKFSHQHIMHDNGSTQLAFVLLVFVGVLIPWSVINTWKHVFETGSSTSSAVQIAIINTFWHIVVEALFGWFTWLIIRRVWQRNIRGFVLWTIHSPGGRVWKVITPRGQRPTFKTMRRVLAIGVPLGGWFHAGQIWFDEDRLRYTVKRFYEYTTDPVTITVRGNYEKILTSPSGAIVKFLQRWPQTTWGGCLGYASDHLKMEELDNTRLNKRVAAQVEEYVELTANVNSLDQQVASLRAEVQAYEQFLEKIVADIKKTTRFIRSRDAKKIVERIGFFQATTPKTSWRNKVTGIRITIAQKPLDELKPGDVPRGLDPEDVATGAPQIVVYEERNKG